VEAAGSENQGSGPGEIQAWQAPGPRCRAGSEIPG